MNHTVSGPLQRPFVLLLSGSTRTTSHTRALTRSVAEAIEGHGGEAYHWDAHDALLPIADPAFHKNAFEHDEQAVRRLDALAHRADAFVLASPVYHNSYSGVLKNTLDHLDIAHFKNKAVGLISHGGDRSTQPVDHLRVVVRGLNGVATPTNVCTRTEDYGGDDRNGLVLTDENIKERVTRFAAELVVFAVLLRPLRSPSYTSKMIRTLTAQEREIPNGGAVVGAEKLKEVVDQHR